jgi:hypothetical protein
MNVYSKEVYPRSRQIIPNFVDNNILPYSTPRVNEKDIRIRLKNTNGVVPIG